MVLLGRIELPTSSLPKQGVSHCIPTQLVLSPAGLAVNGTQNSKLEDPVFSTLSLGKAETLC